ncbi:MAG: hypothetical protein GWP09_02220 [Nitrospiraceae bacterium]|nr:hypothetical protein [Nitrospiraceae bacterium]
MVPLSNKINQNSYNSNLRHSYGMYVNQSKSRGKSNKKNGTVFLVLFFSVLIVLTFLIYHSLNKQPPILINNSTPDSALDVNLLVTGRLFAVDHNYTGERFSDNKRLVGWNNSFTLDSDVVYRFKIKNLKYIKQPNGYYYSFGDSLSVYSSKTNEEIKELSHSLETYSKTFPNEQKEGFIVNVEIPLETVPLYKGSYYFTLTFNDFIGNQSYTKTLGFNIR